MHIKISVESVESLRMKILVETPAQASPRYRMLFETVFNFSILLKFRKEDLMVTIERRIKTA